MTLYFSKPITYLITALLFLGTPASTLPALQSLHALAQISTSERLTRASQLLSEGIQQGSQTQYSTALDVLKEALYLYQEIQNNQRISGNTLRNARRGEADTLRAMGSIYVKLNDHELGVQYYQDSLEIYREIDEPNLEAKTLSRLGTEFHFQQEYEQALTYLNQSLEIYRQLENGYLGEASVLNKIAFTHQESDDYENALAFYEASRNIYESCLATQPCEAGFNNILNNIASLYRSQENYAAAVSIYEGLFKGNGSLLDFDILYNLGIAFYKWGDYELKDIHALQLQENASPDPYTQRQLDLATEYYSEAIDYFDRSLANISQIEDRDSRADQALVLKSIGSVYNKLNNTDLAIVFLKQAVTTYESIRADNAELPPDLMESFSRNFAYTYRSLADLLARQGRILEAQQVLELLKVEELREFTRATYTSDSILYDPLEQEVVDAYGSLISLGVEIDQCGTSSDCDGLYERQRQLKTAYDATIAEFERSIRESRSDDDVFYDPSSLASDAYDIVNTESPTVLIYPIVMEDRLWLLWTATGGIVGKVEVKTTNGATLNRLISQFHQLLGQRHDQSYSEFKQVSQQLYNWLIRPLETELENNDIQQLVFAQDRFTRYLPMGALHDGEQYLIEKYTTYTVLSASLTDTDERLGEIDSVSILGLGLDSSVLDFPALPKVQEELDAIIRTDETDILGTYPGQVFMNEDFTFETLSQQVRRHRVLHIATHAEFIPHTQGESYILSGNGEKLTITQIGSLDVQFRNLHLVVLSACQTALGGEALDGTEIAGVSSYFLGKNKAEAVMATLWRVDDAGTSLLMQRFYELLATGKVTKAEALRQAQLSLLQNEADLGDRYTALGIDRGGFEPVEPTVNRAGLEHPYYWAPFVLIGNGL